MPRRLSPSAYCCSLWRCSRVIFRPGALQPSIRTELCDMSSFARTALALLIPIVTVAAGDLTADALIDNGHFKRAREIAEAAYKTHPDDAHANYVLARIEHEFQNLDQAAKLADAAIRLDPKSSPAHRELGEIYADQAD